MQKQRFVGAVILALMLSSLGATAATPKSTYWVGSWACSVVGERNRRAPQGGASEEDSTIRNVVHLSLGGPAIRLRISNEFGDGPLKIGGVHVAESAGKDATVAGSDHTVTVGGDASFTIPAGQAVVSDPIAMTVPAFADLAISFFVPKTSVFPTYHAWAFASNFTAPGDQASATALSNAKKMMPWIYLRGVDVAAAPDARAVVTLGDSITDGMISTIDANRRWPDDLARRLAGNPKTKNVSVLNAGISGSRILWPQAGPSMLGRFDRDVLAQPGVKYVIVYGGINDINHSQVYPDPKQSETADDLIAGLKQLIARAHAKGLKIYGATITPGGHSRFETPAGLAMREKVNAFIRSDASGYDGLFDFDKVVRDPAHPDTLLPLYGGEASGYIHLYDAGYQALADSIDLSKFQ